MERGGYRGRRRGACRNRGRGGEGGPPRDGGRGLNNHQPEPERGRSRPGEETRRGDYGGERGRGRGGGRPRGGGPPICAPTRSVHSRPLPPDQVLEPRRPQDQQGSTSSRTQGVTLAIGTNRLHLKFKPGGFIMHYNVEVEYRKLWSYLICPARWIIGRIFGARMQDLVGWIIGCIFEAVMQVLVAAALEEALKGKLKKP